jgi:hypothetical protein
MTKLLTATALIFALSAPAFAKDASEQRSFTRDGETYVYTAAVKGAATILAGRSSSGRTFRLTVRDGHVSGTSGGVPVSFDVPVLGRSVELAAR